MKKSIISLLLVAALLFSLVSCGAAMKNNDAMAPNMGMDMEYASNDSVSGTDDGADAFIDGMPNPDYGKFIENEFISTSEENISTFSADVDTASYAYFRKLVEQGYSLTELIATAGRSIRTEEMINYFDYGYSSPAENELFSTTAQIAPCPWNEEAVLMVMGLQAVETPVAQKNNLVFLIDVSGSMQSSDKLGLLKEAFAYLVDNLGEDDTISIVTYAGKERVVLDGCKGSKKTKIMNAVNSLEAGGSTNGEAGLKKAYALAEEHFISGGNNRIIMASDGDLNVGMSSTEEIKSFVSEKKEEGVFLSVLGFGTGNYKDDMMETIADCGNGVYYYIDSEKEAEKIFGAELFSTLYTVAKDVKLQITFNADSISSYRLVGYENRLLNKEDFADDTKDAGDLGSGHSLTVCYELILNVGAKEAENEWFNLAVRYKAPDGNKSELNEYSFGKEAYTDTPNANFKFISSVVELSMIIHESEYAADSSLDDIAADLSALDLGEDEYKEQFLSLVRILAAKQ